MHIQQAKFVTTPDGYNIAYAISGSGTPLVFAPPAFSHIQMVWESPRTREWLEGLAARFQLVQFDFRGQGMSTRGLPAEFTIADYETDLETIVDHLELEPFVLLGTCITGHASVRYAAKHPERLKALILLTTAVSERAWPIGLLSELAGENPDLLLWSGLIPGSPLAGPDPRRERIQQAMTLDDAIVRWKGSADSDVSALLPEIRTQTLVMHPRDFVHLKSEEALKLAAGLPNSRLVMLESDDPGQLRGNISSALEAIDDFVASLQDERGQADLEQERPTRPRLSPRQSEVLGLLLEGKTNREIAADLVLSQRTVERHVEELYAKLEVRNRAEAIAHELGQFGRK